MTPTRPTEADRFELYRARLAHVRRAMEHAGVDALLLCDPNDIFYATGAMNMQVFCWRTPARYLLVTAEGPVILFEYRGCEHLAEHLPTISEIRLAEGLDTVSSTDSVATSVDAFAAELSSELRSHDAETVAIDRFPVAATDALRSTGLRLVAADRVLSSARAIKLAVELPYMREAMRRVDEAVGTLEANAHPGKTEAEVWAHFHFGLMAKEGQHIVTRLFQSGPNTFPYFQECGSRQLQQGDLLCLDTDANGYENYCVDFSRTFLCGDGDPSGEQRTLYGRALEQLEHNAGLLAPGMAFDELAAKAWPVPPEHRASRYYCIGHGLGMSGEWPNIPHDDPDLPYPLDGAIEPGMVLCLESYVGSETSAQGVKLEDQFLITEEGVERMSTYPFDDRLGS